MKRIRFNGLRASTGLALFCVLALGSPARSQQGAGSGAQRGTGLGTELGTLPASATPSGQATAPSPSAQQPTHTVPDRTPALADFAWLEGRWRGEWGARVAEQTWLDPKAGEMTGIFRLVEGDKTLVLELFSLVEKPDGIAFYFRHFTPELRPWEKSDATILHLESLDATNAVFVNPLNGEPKRASLIKVDADTYTARSELEPEQSDPQTIEITFHRQKPPAAAPSGGSGARRKKP